MCLKFKELINQIVQISNNLEKRFEATLSQLSLDKATLKWPVS